MQNKYAIRSGGLPPATAATRSRWVFSVWLLLCLLVSSAAVFGQTDAVADAYTAAGLDLPTASSDKEDYLPGEIAIITGSGWKLDQYVDIHFEEEPAFHGEHQHDYHNTTVKADGSWEIRYPIEQRHKGVAFTVHVIGKQSGYEATTWFTDGTITVTSNTNWSALDDPDVAGIQPPSSNDAIVVKNGATLTVNVANAICGSLKLGDSGQNAGRGTIVFNNGSTLTVSTAGGIAGGGDVTIGHNTSNPGTITMTAGGTLVIGGAVTVNAGSVTPSSAGTIEFNNSAEITLPNLAYNNLVLSNNGKVVFAKDDARITTINGNLTVNKTGETFFLSEGKGNATFNVMGSFSMLQGTMNLASGNGVGHLSVRGNFTHTGGTISRTGNNGGGTIFFDGPSIQNYTGGGNFSGAVNFWVLDGSTLYLGNNVLGSNNAGSSQSTGTFNLVSGATLGIGSPAGITLEGATGNVRVTGTRTYTAGANYIYNGTVAQSTGNGLPSNTTGTVTINNAAGVTLADSRTVSGALLLSNGVLFTGSNALTLGTGAQLLGAGPGKYVDGRLRRDGLSAGSVTFPIGKAGNYRPVVVNVASGAGSIEAEQFESGFGGTFPAGNGALGSRFWRLSQPSGNISNFSLTLDGTGTSPSGAVSIARFASSTTQLFPATGTAPSYIAAGLNGFGDFTLSQVTAIATSTGVENATATYGDAAVNLVAKVTPSAATGSVEFFVNGTAVGTANLSSGTATFTYNLGGVSADTYTIRASYAGSGSYTASNSGNATLTVSPKALTASVTANGKTYDGTADATIASRSLNGKVGDDDVTITGGTAAFADKNVGTNKTVTASGFSLTGAAAGNYRLAANSASTTASITARALTIGITATGKVYDGNTNATVSAAIADGLVSGDQLTVAVANGQFNNKNAGANKTVTASVSITGGSDAGNYAANASATTQADITAKPVTATLDATDKVYDGTDEASAGGSVPVLGSDAVTVTVTDARFNNKTVGNDKPVMATVALSGAAAGNYRLTAGTASTTASITAKALAVNVTAQNKVYDGNANANVAAAITEGLVDGDDVTVSAANGLFADKNVGENKEVTASISKSGDDAGNYTVNASAKTKADITARELTASFTANDRMYDGTAAAVIATRGVNGKVGSDDVELVGGTAAFENRNAGDEKTVNGTGFALGGTAAGNYRLASGSASSQASIAVRPLTVTANADSREYNGTNVSEVAPTTPALQPGDAVATAPVQHFNNKNVGSGKIINASGLAINDGNNGNNYAVSYVPSTDGEITAKALTASITAQDKVYDGNDVAQVSASIASGLVAGDAVTVSASNGKFTDKNVGQNKEVTASISKSGADAGNYTVNASAKTTADITAKALTAAITAQNKEYDGNTTATATGSVPAADVVDGDEVPVTVTNARFNNKQVGTGKPVTADVSIGNGNYRLTAATAQTTASITAKDLTIGITAANKVYDGTNAATVTPAIMDGLVAGDQVTVAATGGAFNNKQVGTDKPVTADVRISGGADAGNYTANATASGAADVTKRDLVVSATGQNKVYDGNATATVTLSDNRVAGDGLTLAYASATFNNKNVGANKPVSVSGISVTGTDAGNYAANVIATTTADITKRNLVVTAAGVNKVYDGTTTATVNLSDNRLAGDQFTLAYAAASFDNRNAGTNKAVTVTGIAISGAEAGNYAANATASTTADITPKAIAGAFTAGDKVYDGTAAATVATRTLSGIISPDAVTLTGGTAAFADKHVGTGKSVTLTGATLAGANAGNYSLASVNTTTASITRRTLVVTATGVNKVYDGTTAATVILSDNRVAGDALTLSYASASFNTINVGTAKPVSVSGISVTGADAANYNFNTTAQATANITAAPVVLTASVAPASQQYSDRVTFTARVAGGAPLGTGTAGAAQTVTFSVGTQVMGTANLMVDGIDLVATLPNVALLELPTANGQMAPGNKTVKAVFGLPNADYGLNGTNNLKTNTFEITREDALAEYTGAASVATSSTTSSSAVVTLSATLRDISAATDNALTDANPGDIRNARIRFVRIDNGVVTPVTNTSATNGAITDAAGWTTVGLVNAADLKTGTMLIKTTVTIGNGDATQVTYRIEVAGYYQSGEESFVVNVYKPLNDFITGGGHIVPTASAGTYASDAGRKTNFGFNVRYNKTGKNLQGNINTIFRRKESDGIVHVYQIKGNAMTSLSVNAAVATAKTAVFNGKANMTDITNPLMPVPLGGNLTLQVTMTDRGEPGINDQIGITVYNNAGGIFYASNWSGTRTAEMNLRGGNLVVNSGSMTFGTTTATGRESAAAAQSAETTTAFTVTAYPNPFADKVTLSIGSEVTGDVAIAVVDGKGRTVTRQVAKAAEQGSRTVEIDLSGESHGMYLLHVQSGAKREVVKVFKSNR